MVFKLFKGACKRKLKLETTPFQRKVLLTLQNLQGNRKFHGGVTVKDIESYIVQNYKIDGDTHTQIKIALEQLILYGTVNNDRNFYKLIGPFANVTSIPNNCYKERSNEIRRLESIYPTVWDYCGKSTCLCSCTMNKLCSECNKEMSDYLPSTCTCKKKQIENNKCSCTVSKSSCCCKPIARKKKTYWRCKKRRSSRRKPKRPCSCTKNDNDDVTKSCDELMKDLRRCRSKKSVRFRDRKRTYKKQFSRESSCPSRCKNVKKRPCNK